MTPPRRRKRMEPPTLVERPASGSGESKACTSRLGPSRRSGVTGPSTGTRLARGVPLTAVRGLPRLDVGVAPGVAVPPTAGASTGASELDCFARASSSSHASSLQFACQRRIHKGESMTWHKRASTRHTPRTHAHTHTHTHDAHHKVPTHKAPHTHAHRDSLVTAMAYRHIQCSWN